MKRNDLKKLIREAVEEVMNEFAPLGVAEDAMLQEGPPPGVPRDIYTKTIKKHGDKKGHKLLWKAFYAKEAGHKKMNEMWMGWESKSTNEGIAEEDPNNPLYVEYVSEMRDEEPFMMGSQKFQFVNAKYPNGKKDIGVYAFSGDVVYSYDAFRKMYNLNEEEAATHDETDLSNPEEKREVELAKKAKAAAEEILKMHGK